MVYKGKKCFTTPVACFLLVNENVAPMLIKDITYNPVAGVIWDMTILNRKYKDYVYRKMLVQEYLKK